jgi:hypothetical protein
MVSIAMTPKAKKIISDLIQAQFIEDVKYLCFFAETVCHLQSQLVDGENRRLTFEACERVRRIAEGLK